VVLGRPFVCYRTIVCPVLSVYLSDLSVCDVGVLWPNGLTEQDEIWRAGRPQPWPHCVRWGPSSPSPKGAPPTIPGPHPLRPSGCIDQDFTWYGGRPQPRRPCGVRWGPSSLPKKGTEPGLPNFWPISVVVKRLAAPRCHLVRS